MKVLNRHFLKTELPGLIKFIQENHVMGPEIEKELFVDNKPVKGLCHQRGYFIIMGDQCMKYVMDHIILNPETGEIGRKVDSVVMYDSYIEYETERVKAMIRVAPDEQTGLNLN